MTRALALFVVLGTISCSDRGPRRPHAHRTTQPARAEPNRSRHGSHEHGHGAHPHGRDAHHHHPHPHPHLDGVKGHHHPH